MASIGDEILSRCAAAGIPRTIEGEDQAVILPGDDVVADYPIISLRGVFCILILEGGNGNAIAIGTAGGDSIRIGGERASALCDRKTTVIVKLQNGWRFRRRIGRTFGRSHCPIGPHPFPLPIQTVDVRSITLMTAGETGERSNT